MVRARGWDVLGRFAPSASPSGRRTHVSLCSVTTFLPPPPSNFRGSPGESRFRRGALNLSATSPGFCFRQNTFDLRPLAQIFFLFFSLNLNPIFALFVLRKRPLRFHRILSQERRGPRLPCDLNHWPSNNLNFDSTAPNFGSSVP